MTFFRFALRRSVRGWPNRLLLFLFPLALVALPRGEYTMLPIGFQYYALLAMFAASKLVHLVMEDRTNRILMRIAAAPVTHLQYLWQNLLAYALLLCVQSAAVVAIGRLVHGPLIVSPALLLAAFCLFSVTAIAFTLAWCSLFRSKETSITILFAVMLLMGMVGGTFWPVWMMPEWLSRLAMFLPTYWLNDALRIITSGEPAVNLLPPFGIMILFTTAFLIAGSQRRLV